ncbi:MULTISPECIES: MmgE/PrpD family protein [unclassified Pseudofrankia]|uniref:MmgE/PrpD family protein n=1 Tax=unclassified Pseudofrankia TaxID=2994372 RepID=UPI0008DAC994|nr:MULTISPECIES: MmgE/PrpD family protein [unclassified Pseudofrankia]MDT3444669.1 MmgE/PrpD family protein [Pseudofrankia sp. BMG5.37]OHV66588.1 hypothetical protein BCD48_35910 [Pseudofrankia sp. BMG5.36]
MTTQKTDVTLALSDFVANTPMGSVPDEVLAVVAASLLDAIGGSLAGSTATGVPEVLGVLNAWGGNSRSRAWVTGERLAEPWAAFANSAMLHGRDYDDTDDAVPLHAYSGVLPAAWAILDSSEEPVPGRVFLETVVIGLEVASRIGRAGGPKSARGWNSTALCAGWGAVAAASRMLRLDAERTANAFGLQLCQTSGTTQALIEATLAKRISPAFAAKSGVISARLAEAGITGPHEALEGSMGYFHLYQDDRYDRNVVLDGLGDRYGCVELSLKPYPCCRFTHPVIDIGREISTGHKLTDIASLEIHGSSFMASVVGRPVGQTPMSEVDAQFSAAYTATVAIDGGNVGLDDFAPSRRSDDALVSFARERVRVLVDEALPATAVAPVRAVLTTTTGKTQEYLASDVLGSPDRPMSGDDIDAKVRACAAHAIVPIDADALIAAVRGIANLEDARSLSDILAPPPAN